MSKLPFAKLLVDMYWFEESDRDAIASMLTDEDQAVIRDAIAALFSRKSGDRLQTIIHRYYGIDGERQTLRQIGEAFEVPITASRVRELRNQAQRYMCREVGLRPLLVRITEAGIVGSSYHVGITIGQRTPVQLDVPPEQVAEPTVSVPSFTGSFIIDCFPTCMPENPCPSCRAKDLLAAHGLVSEFETLAREWTSGPTTDWQSISLRSFEFSVRTANCFINEKVRTLAQLCAMSEGELLRIPNFGRASLNEVIEFLSTMNLQLRGR